MEILKSKLKKIFTNEYVVAFLLIYVIGLIAFSISAAPNSFTIPMGGDYVLQTYAFYAQGYELFWQFIKTGQIPLFDFSNYLGANFLGTQSFYYVFSPLFYLLCLWPRKWLYQGIFFHMVFKFAVGGFFIYVLLRRYFNVSKLFSFAGGFIYAYSGFTLFYLWFHFSDTIAFFPLFIIGVERCLQKKKGDILSIGLFLCGLSNYFFLVNYCIFGVFYCLFRWISIYGLTKKRGHDIKERYFVLLQGVIHATLGVLMAGICLFPSLVVAQAASRSQMSRNYLIDLLEYLFKNPSFKNGKFVLSELKPLSEIFKWSNIKEILHTIFIWDDKSFNSSEFNGSENVGYILASWLFMNTNCWDNILYHNSGLDNSLGGFFITTPLTMLLIPSIVRTIKSKRFLHIFALIVCLVAPFIPFTGHMAFGFTSLYGRWQIWIVLIGILYIIPTIDNFETVDRRLVTINLILNIGLGLYVFFNSKKLGKLPTSDTLTILGIDASALIWLALLEGIIMLLMWFIYRFKFFNVKVVKRLAVLVMVLEVGASTVITVQEKGYSNWNEYIASQDTYYELYDLIKDLQEEDPTFYRILNTEATRLQMNMPSQLNYAGASTFNSTYDFYLDDFKNRSRMSYSGGWTMGDHEKRYWYDQYIGTKYYIVNKQDPNNDNYEYHRDRSTYFDGRYNKDQDAQAYNLNLGWNYSLYKSYDTYDVYINNDYIGIGYSVDCYMNDSTAGTGSLPTYYEELYASTAILEDDDVEEITNTLTNLEKRTIYSTDYGTSSFLNKFDLYFSPREDADKNNLENKNYSTRNTYKLEESNFTKKEISTYLASNQQFFHKRWEDTNRFGDEFILELKGDGYLCTLASEENPVYVALNLKLGPKILVSFYHDDELITQDAHMNSNSSLAKDIYEWKNQRGYYLTKPFNKVVLEFVSDTNYDQLFASDDKLRTLSICYSYYSEIKDLQDRVNANLIEDVNYTTDKFTFKTNTDTKKLYVTNIPYDNGWTLKANGVEKKMYVVNGGFIGFIADEGEVNYELTYYTPNLKLGIFSTVGSMLICIFLCYIYNERRKRIDLIEKGAVINYEK